MKMSEEAAIHERPVVYQVPGMDQVEVQRDLTYRTVEGAELKLDVYSPSHPPDTGPHPGVVFIHGGPYPRSMPVPTRWGQYRSWGRLAAASGLVGVTFGHRYHDYACLEQAYGDILAALDYVRLHAAAFSLDPDRLALWSGCGGAPFLISYVQGQPEFVRCFVLYYPILDLRPTGRAAEVLGPELIERFSPVIHFDLTDVPMFIVRAGLDDPELNRSIDLFVQKALAINAPLDLANHARGRHAFDILDDDARSREIIARTIEFIKANT